MPGHDNTIGGGGSRAAQPPEIPAGARRTPTMRGRQLEVGAERMPAPVAAPPAHARTTLSIRLKLTRDDQEKLDAAARDAASNDERFLGYGSALYRAKEICHRGNEGGNHTDARDEVRGLVAKSLEILAERGEERGMDAQMLKAFSKLMSDDNRLYDYLFWMQEMEAQFERLSGVYGNLGMNVLTSYDEVISACESRARNGSWDDSGPEVREFYRLISGRKHDGEMDEVAGERGKRMFDSWFSAASAEAMMKRNEVSPALMGQVHELRGKITGLEGENSALSAKVKRGEEKVASLTQDLASEKYVKERALERVGELESDGKGGASMESNAMLVELETLRETVKSVTERIAQMEAAVREKDLRIAELARLIAAERETSAGFAERVKVLTAANDGLQVDVQKKDREADALRGLVTVRDKRVQYLEGENARQGARIAELSAATEPELVGRPTVVSVEMPVPPEVVAAATAGETSAIKDLRALARAAEAPAAAGVALGKAAAPVAGKGSELSVATMIRQELEKPSVAPPAPVLAKAVAKMAARPENTEPIDIEAAAEEYEAAASMRAGFWGTRPGKAVKAIFAYGFAGKGEIMAHPVSRVVELPSISEGVAYGKALRELEDEKARYEREMREYSAWYNVVGRFVHARREEAINAANAVSRFSSKNARKIGYAAAGVAGVGALVGVVAVTYLSLSGTPQTTQLQNQVSSGKPAAAQVASADTGKEMEFSEKEAEEAEAQAAPQYDLDSAIKAALANNGISEIDSAKGIGPQLRVLYNAAMKMEGQGAKYAALAYASNFMLDGKYQMKMDNTVVRNLLISAMGEGRNFTMENPGATASVVRLVERASQVLDANGGFSGAKATPGQAVLYKSILEWKEGVPQSLLVERAPAKAAAPAVVDAGIASAPAVAAASAPAPAVAFDILKVAESAFANNSIASDAHPRDIYKAAMKVSNLEERLAMLTVTADRVYGSKELQHKMSEAVIAQIIVDGMDTAVDFGSLEGQGISRKKAALEIAKRLSGYVGPKGEFNGRAPSQDFAKKVRNARELMIILEEDVNAMEAASMRGSPTASNGVAPALPVTVVDGESPAFTISGPSDEFTERAFKVNGLSMDDPPRKIYMASWNMKTSERYAVLSTLALQISENPKLVSEEEYGLKVDIYLSAAEAGYIVSNTTGLFGGNALSGAYGVLLNSKDLLDILGKPGEEGHAWTPEQVARRDKISFMLDDQIARRGGQMNDELYESEKEIEAREKAEKQEAKRKARKAREAEKKKKASEDEPYGG